MGSKSLDRILRRRPSYTHLLLRCSPLCCLGRQNSNSLQTCSTFERVNNSKCTHACVLDCALVWWTRIIKTCRVSRGFAAAGYELHFAQKQVSTSVQNINFLQVYYNIYFVTSLSLFNISVNNSLQLIF